MKMYIVKDEFKKKSSILLIPEIYEQIDSCLLRTGIVYKHSNFQIRYGSYDNFYSYEEVTKENAHVYKREIKMLNTAINREREKRKWNKISHKAIFMFYDEFVEMYTRLLIYGDDKNVKNI